MTQGIDRDYFHVDFACPECGCEDWEEKHFAGMTYYVCHDCEFIDGLDFDGDGE